HSEGIAYSQLVSRMMEYVEATPEDLEAYTNRLIEFGFLEFDLGVSGIDPDWDMTLRKKLSDFSLDSTIVSELLDFLMTFRAQADLYATSDVAQRELLLKQSYGLFRSYCKKLHEHAR